MGDSNALFQGGTAELFPPAKGVQEGFLIVQQFGFIGQGDQFKADFLAICPNNRMPAMVDTEPSGGGEPVALFESGAIMMYIAEKAGQFYPQDLRGRHEVNQWLIWRKFCKGRRLPQKKSISWLKASFN